MGQLDLDAISHHPERLTVPRAVALSARAFHEAFRDTDVIARVATGTFVVLGAEKAEAVLPELEQRVLKRLTALSRSAGQSVPLNLASARWSADDPTSLDDLLGGLSNRLR